MTAWLEGQLATPPLGRVLAGVRQPVRFIAGEHELPNLDFPRPLLPRQADLEILPSENHVSAFLRTDVVVTAIRRLRAETHATTLARRRRERWA